MLRELALCSSSIQALNGGRMYLFIVEFNTMTIETLNCELNVRQALCAISVRPSSSYNPPLWVHLHNPAHKHTLTTRARARVTRISVPRRVSIHGVRQVNGLWNKAPRWSCSLEIFNLTARPALLPAILRFLRPLTAEARDPPGRRDSISNCYREYVYKYLLIGTDVTLIRIVNDWCILRS